MDYFGEPSNVFYPPSNSPSRTATVESLGNRLGRTPPRPALKQNGDGSANDYERKPNAVTFVEDVPHADGLKEVRVIISSSFEDEDSYEEDRGSSPEKRKKKKYRRGPRDSLASRMQVGKPGSRRHQRYLNKAHLTDEETDEEDPFTLINGEVQPPEWRSAFQDVLDSPEKQRFMEPFLDTPLEEEQAFLDALDEEEDDGNRVTLDRLSRKMLVKYYGTDFLTDLDKHISAFAEIVGRSPASKTVVQPKLDLFSQHFATKVDFVRERMTITFKDSFHRLLAHSVCRYYSLTSNSENCNGTRVTVITLPRHCVRPICLPPLTLQDFLAKERSHVISSRAS